MRTKIKRHPDGPAGWDDAERKQEGRTRCGGRRQNQRVFDELRPELGSECWKRASLRYEKMRVLAASAWRECGGRCRDGKQVWVGKRADRLLVVRFRWLSRLLFPSQSEGGGTQRDAGGSRTTTAAFSVISVG